MDPELERVFNRAVESGVRLFDTADSYGTGAGFDGRSEILLGEFLKACPSDKARDVILELVNSLGLVSPAPALAKGTSGRESFRRKMRVPSSSASSSSSD